MLSLFKRKAEDQSLRVRKEKALRLFREWNEVTGFVPKGISYEGELESLIEDAVEIGMFGRTLKGPK